MTFGPAEIGRVADFVTMHPAFTAAPVAALCGLAWALARRGRSRSRNPKAS